MPCPVCVTDHPLGTPHVFSHLNKVVTRPGCPQCETRDRVIDHLIGVIGDLQHMLDPVNGAEIHTIIKKHLTP